MKIMWNQGCQNVLYCVYLMQYYVACFAVKAIQWKYEKYVYFLYAYDSRVSHIECYLCACLYVD